MELAGKLRVAVPLPEAGPAHVAVIVIVALIRRLGDAAERREADLAVITEPVLRQMLAILTVATAIESAGRGVDTLLVDFTRYWRSTAAETDDALPVFRAAINAPWPPIE